jgi:5-methylcytosine-specific restriction endonuclease McrA
MKYDWQRIRMAVWDRDKGVCSECGFDDQARRRLFSRLDYGTRRYLGRLYFKQGFPGLRWWQDWWQAHHVTPRKAGGTNELGNLRTLCIPCHVKTFKQAPAALERH